MTRIHPFPKKIKRTASKTAAADLGTAFFLLDGDGNKIDVLLGVIQAGAVIFNQQSTERGSAAQLREAIFSCQELTHLTNVILMYLNEQGDPQSSTRGHMLNDSGNLTWSLLEKLDDMVPPEHIIQSVGSHALYFLVEYAAHAARSAVVTFSDVLLTQYESLFIRTKKDGRKQMLKDFRRLYEDTVAVQFTQSKDYSMVIKDIVSAQRALVKITGKL